MKIYNPYNDDVFWTTFEILEDQEWFSGYAYEFSKEKIKKSLKLLDDPKIFDDVKFEIETEWQKLKPNPLIPKELEHYIRIAMLSILLKRKDGWIKPISIDSFCHDLSKIDDGHHRLLALKFLNKKEFPFYFSGVLDFTKSLGVMFL